MPRLTSWPVLISLAGVLTILAEGRLVAEGASRQLMADIDAEIFEIEGEDTAAAQKPLAALPWVRGVAQLGMRLHVLADRGRPDSLALLQARLKEQGLALVVSRTVANLEDVFVVATRTGAPDGPH